MCQCPLFKQFTTGDVVVAEKTAVFIVCVNVLFLSNSQRGVCPCIGVLSDYRMCQCPLFKQFTTIVVDVRLAAQVFIVSVNVLF